MYPSSEIVIPAATFVIGRSSLVVPLIGQTAAPVEPHRPRFTGSSTGRRGSDSCEVTDRGRPITVLTPLPDRGPIEHLKASGDVVPSQHDLDDLPDPLPLGPARNRRRACSHASDAMSADRATFLDSSALVKLAVRKPESAALRRYLRPRRPLRIAAHHPLYFYRPRRHAHRPGTGQKDRLIACSCQTPPWRRSSSVRAPGVRPQGDRGPLTNSNASSIMASGQSRRVTHPRGRLGRSYI
jgi:antitoxin (DNA-binding transcriptional repressor) of toxin-antitoxin stability system